MFRLKSRAGAALSFGPCGKTFPQPARRLESFFCEGSRKLLPLQRRGCDVGLLHAAAAHRDQLRKDADGNFFRRDGADVEANRRVYAREALEWHAFFNQRVVDLLHLGLAADETEVAEVARRK